MRTREDVPRSGAEGCPFHSERKEEERLEQRVKAANRLFYDTVGAQYEEVDGRRSQRLERWLSHTLSTIRQNVPDGHLLDIGTGGGLVTRCAQGIFTSRIGIDLSTKILAANRGAFDWGLTADADYLPFAAGCFDVVTSFAVLHHLYRFEGVISEVARVLRLGGIFYTDHDMDTLFFTRFRPLLCLYRTLCNNAQSRYSRVQRDLTKELYTWTEWQEKGVDSASLVPLLYNAGFNVTIRFHWFGLTPMTDMLFGHRTFPRGWAPLFSIVAVKERETTAHFANSRTC